MWTLLNVLSIFAGITSLVYALRNRRAAGGFWLLFISVPLIFMGAVHFLQIVWPLTAMELRILFLLSLMVGYRLAHRYRSLLYTI